MNIYEIEVKNALGVPQSLAQYKGKVLLIVNTASNCGFTPQYSELQELYERFSTQDLEILAFPCDQFAHQEPGSDAEIQAFCQMNYGVTFPVYAKIDVNGEHADPLFQYLRSHKGGVLGNAIKWNFTKFLVDRQGQVVARYAPNVAPLQLAADIQALLEQPLLV